ncbi:MAG: transporter [Candidatus Brocadiales bacterium]|nr:transporter [Candidatus Brocadiales bacterium]
MLFIIKEALAHHEGTVEAKATGTINTVSGETLPKGKVVTSFRYDRREFDAIPDDQLTFLTRLGEDVHAHKREINYRGSVSYGLTNDLTLSLSLPWNSFDQFSEATLEDSEIRFIKGDSDGIGDLLLQGKYMFLHTHPDHVSFLGGVKFPTGDTHEKARGKERFGTHNQPGSGSVDGRLGFAWSRTYNRRWGIDADIIYEIRTEGAQDFETGDAVLLDLGLSYAINKNPIIINDWLRPRVTLVGEVNAAHQERDTEKDERLQHSGVTIVYLSPGIRVGVNKRTNLWLTGSIPVFQHLSGEQAYEKWRMGAGISISW